MPAESVAQMLAMLVIAGVLVAWLAQIPLTSRGYGFVADIALGLAGSVGAGALVWARVTGDAGFTGTFWVGIVGATIAIVAQRRLWPMAGVR